MIKMITMLAITLFCTTTQSQVLVNGKYQGDVYRSSKVVGQVMVSHVFGKQANMPVKSAWVNIHGTEISIGANTDQPTFDGILAKNYFHRGLQGSLPEASNNKYSSMTLTDISNYTSRQGEYVTTTVATIMFKDKKPSFVYYYEIDSGDVNEIRTYRANFK